MQKNANKKKRIFRDYKKRLNSRRTRESFLTWTGGEQVEIRKWTEEELKKKV